MKVRWFRCRGNVWCDLFKLDLSNDYVKTIDGVYVIWTGDLPKKVLRIGSGNITRELSAIKREISFKAFQHHGLKVSWAEISALQRNGTLVYLYSELMPTMQKEIPKGMPFHVNLPWDNVKDDEYDDAE